MGGHDGSTVLRLKRRNIEQQAKAAQGHLAWIESFAARIADGANDSMDDGIAGINYAAVNRGGNELTGPERYADKAISGRSDRETARAQRFLAALTLASASAAEARKLAGSLFRIDTDNRLVAPSGTAGEGHCLNCNTECEGTAHDRLRGGRCDPCRKYPDSHGGMERPRKRWSA